jgi:hypothetical protein
VPSHTHIHVADSSEVQVLSAIRGPGREVMLCPTVQQILSSAASSAIQHPSFSSPAI